MTDCFYESYRIQLLDTLEMEMVCIQVISKTTIILILYNTFAKNATICIFYSVGAVSYVRYVANFWHAKGSIPLQVLISSDRSYASDI